MYQEKSCSIQNLQLFQKIMNSRPFCPKFLHYCFSSTSFFPQNTNTKTHAAKVLQNRFFFLFILTFVIKMNMKETLLQINIEKQINR